VDVYQVIVSPKARKQIHEITDFVRAESEQGAAMLTEKFEEAIDSLDILPRRRPVREPRRNSAKTTYGVVVYSYLIYYRVDDAKKIVRITDIRHGARRQPRRFR
jgi:plasmid stabilization system protein ParE